MNRPVPPCGTWLSSGERPAAAAERGVIQHGQIRAEQAQNRTGEALGLTEREMEDEP